MSKRHTDTDKWTNNRWFQRLPGKYKLLWFYMWDMCDNVGVWSADLELAMLMTGFTYTEDEALEAFGDHVEVINEKTKDWWLVEYCEFHHSDFCDKCREGIDEPTNNNALKSYYTLMNQHDLWGRFLKRIESKGYTRGTCTPHGKARLGKERQGKEKKEYAPTVHMTPDEHAKLVDLIGQDNTARCITKLSDYKGSKGKTYTNDYKTIRNWTIKEVTGRPTADWEMDKERHKEEAKEAEERNKTRGNKEPIPEGAKAELQLLQGRVGEMPEVDE